MKRALSLILIMALALTLTACASIFDGEYFSSSVYVPPSEEPVRGGATQVSSYLQLRLVLNNLITEHGESELIHFTSAYSGDIAADLAAACREARDETALGSYAVDYISYDLDRIVAYYEAEVYVYYKRSAGELEDMLSVNTASDLYDAICAALAELSTELVVTVGASTVDEAAVLDFVDRAYFSDPLACVERPRAEARVYTGGGFQRIVELRLDYGLTTGVLSSRRDTMSGVLERLAASVTSESEPYRALQAYSALYSHCGFSEDAPGSLWSALVGRSSGSEGMAVAYKALCDAAGIDCVVVEGRLDRAEHYWNIITVDGASYHADPSRISELGFGGSFLRSDVQMWGSYWWDDQYYPSCSGPLTYASLTEPDPEPEPTDSPVPTPAPSITPTPSPTE